MLSQEFLQKLGLPDLEDVSQYVKSISTPVLVSMGAVAAATTYYLATRPKALPQACDLSMQSVEVPGGEFARRSVLLNGEGHLTHVYDDARTMYEFFLRGARVSNNGPCLGSRKPKQPYEWMSYKEVMERTENLGSAFLHKGHSKTSNCHIGIFSQNRPEWTISELACYTYSLVSVPLYDTLGTEAIGYIIDKASITTIVCDVVDKVNLVLDCVKDKEHTVKNIILMETPSEDLVNRGQQAGIHILSLQEMETIGKANHQPPVPPRPEDMAVVCFTSGTTGNPKGAMLTHGNIVANCSAFIKTTESSAKTIPEDVMLSFLPLAHMFERVVEIFGQANSSLKRWVLDFAFRRKEAEMLKGIMRRDTIWDRLIFRKVQASLGGRVRLMATGAAPISPTVLTFLRAAIGCQFFEGYGQTECTAGCTLTMPGDWTAGHVGAPLPCNTVKLVDVSEMNYLAANGEGEVCVKGPNVFQGYLKDPEKTKEAIDEDGWLHTGDIGKWLPNGTLKIVDRKKHIFKLAQGEYIAPEKIENIYTRSDAVAQIYVHGDSLQACLVAMVVPDPDFLPGWAKRTLGLEGSYQELCGRAEVKAAIFEDMQRLGKEGGLKSFEQVKAINIHTEMFSIENGLLTPTLKAKRNEMQKYFRSQIDELYAGIKIAKKGRGVCKVPPRVNQKARPLDDEESPNLSLIERASFLEGLQINYGNPLHSTAMEEDLNVLEEERVNKGKAGRKDIPQTFKTNVKQRGAAMKRKETELDEDNDKENEVKARPEKEGETKKKKGGPQDVERKESGLKGNQPIPTASGPKRLVGKKTAKLRGAEQTSAARPTETQQTKKGNKREHELESGMSSESQSQEESDSDTAQQRRREVLSSDEDVGDEEVSWKPSPKKARVYNFDRRRKSLSKSRKSSSGSTSAGAEKGNADKQRRKKRVGRGVTDLEVVLDAFLDFCEQYRESVETKAVKHSIDSFCSSVKEQLLEKISSYKELKVLKRENAKVASSIRAKTQRLLDAKHELMRKMAEVRGDGDVQSTVDAVDAFSFSLKRSNKEQNTKTAEEADSSPISSSTKAAVSDPYRYKMDYPDLGVCLIINNKNFHSHTRKYTHFSPFFVL
ncbi:Long-chain-fatty-acid--CoA ligase 1 [Nibea albiflora]|uniref:Long-chain-fatty-acid--CoA ligase 1 n=1 Tax=Nibea albiflora TaxID=240163 RepID=A0ACB7ETY9_NIBAL|nr:Long-chain-fatty-acid--CoA ligase 1 [Nibea albiflora]